MGHICTEVVSVIWHNMLRKEPLSIITRLLKGFAAEKTSCLATEKVLQERLYSVLRARAEKVMELAEACTERSCKTTHIHVSCQGFSGTMLMM